MRFRFLLAPVLAISVYALPEIEFAPKDQEVVVGENAGFGVIPRQQKQFTFQWSKDGTPIPGATNDQIVLRSPKFTDAGLYSVTVFDAEGSATADARLAVRAPKAGDVDFSFDPDVLTETPAPITLCQPDGKLIVTGSFSHMNGQLRRGITRLNADGSTDITFNARLSGLNHQVNALALQRDGKLVIAGYLDAFEGESWDGGIARLNRDGSVDRTFQKGSVPHPSGGWTMALAIQDDGKILVGTLLPIIGTGVPAVYSLNTDGTLDSSFESPWKSEPDAPGFSGVPAWISTIAQQGDGTILVGFSQSRTALVRLAGNGALDTNFVTPTITQVATLEIDASGRTVVAGAPMLRRLNSDGTADSTFTGVFPLVPYRSSAMILKSGKIAVTGLADDTLPPGSLVILEEDGTIASEFPIPGAYRSRVLAADEDDNVLVLTSISNQFVHSWIDLKGESRRIVPFNALIWTVRSIRLLCRSPVLPSLVRQRFFNLMTRYSWV
jgi:uncharacterized delta-60 repeat protein